MKLTKINKNPLFNAKICTYMCPPSTQNRGYCINHPSDILQRAWKILTNSLLHSAWNVSLLSVIRHNLMMNKMKIFLLL